MALFCQIHVGWKKIIDIGLDSGVEKQWKFVRHSNIIVRIFDSFIARPKGYHLQDLIV